MSHSLMHKRLSLSIRTLLMIALLEVVNEFGDELVLTHWHIPADTFKIHIVKIAVALALAIPVILSWLLQESKRLKKADMELEQSQQDYRSLFDHNPDGVYLLNERGEFSNANPSFLHMTGYCLDELKQMSRLDFPDETDGSELAKHVQRAQAGESCRYEARLPRKDKRSDVEVNVTYFPMYQGRRLSGSYAIVQDVTERNRAERELRETQQMLTSFISNTTDIIAIFDADGTILRVNRGFTETFDYQEWEIVGENVTKIIPDDWLDDTQEAITAVLKNQVVSSKDAVRMRKDGELIEVNTTLSPITNHKGDVFAVAVIGRDVTEDKRLARELEEMHSQFESLVHNTADAISILDVHGRVILVNPSWERLYGWTSEEIKGQVPPMLSQMFDRVLACEQSFTEEQVTRRKNGSEVTVSATGSPVYSSHGKITGVSFISKDLTEQKQAEEIIYNAEKLKLVASLAAGIAHEIRNPLTSVKGFLELMKTHFDAKYLDILQSEVHRINEITNEFLLLAKPQAQAKNIEDLTQLLQEVLMLMESQTHMHSISVHVDTENIPKVSCVKSHIKQVFINLIKNAVEAMEDGGQLSISFSEAEGGVGIQIVDNGSGIPEEILEKMGEPFYTTKERGTGLGLMVTYRIVQSHGGTIRISSTLGQGTKVHIYLPEGGSTQESEAFAMTAGGV